jgi:CBS domain-containing protein
MNTAHNLIPDRIANALRQFPPFSMFDEDTIRKLAQTANVQVLTEGDAVWKQGDPPNDEVLFLARGRVEYYRQTGGERSELIDVRDVGDILGLSALHEGEPYRVTARAAEDCILYSLPWDSVRELLATNDQARYYVRRHLFWGTRVGRSVPDAGLESAESSGNILEAHLKGAHTITPRPIDRLLFCGPDTPIRDAAARMAKKRVPSILVADGERRPVGILTGSDLVKEVIVGGLDSALPVSNIMASPVVTVARNSSTTAATLIMLRERIGQVCVTEDGTANTAALDVCTQKDLLAQSGRHPAGFIHEIRIAQTPARFREICDDIEEMALTYLEAGISGLLLGEICAELYDELIRQMLDHSLAEMTDEGLPIPDMPWAWLAVGSDGRREQVLRTDMDNALVFASSGSLETDEQNRKFFLNLATRVIELLVQAGFARCQGGVMASNPNWCKTDQEWHAELQTGDITADGTRLLRSLILYDLRYVAGDKELCRKLRATVFDEVGKDKTLQRHLAEMVVATPPPLNFRGKFVVEKKGGNEGEFDIKKRGLVPLRDAARLFALHYRLTQHHSTGGRWLELAMTQPEMVEMAHLARQGYDLLLRIRTLTGIVRHDAGRFVDPERLTKLQRGQLVNVFDVQRMVQAAVRVHFQLDMRGI